MTRLLPLLALTACGCTGSGAILELDVGLPARPPAPSTVGHAFIQARSATEAPFDADWEGDDPDGVPLEASPTRIAVSVVAGSDHVESPLHVRVRYCTDPRCARFEDTGATEVQVTVDRAFYPGERTFLLLDLPGALPVTVHEISVPKCRVRGCVGGTTSTFCRSDGTHFCE